MRRRRMLATLGAVVATGGAGCTAVGSLGGVDGDVGMTAVAFEPATITVDAGEELVWYNNSARAHSITAYEGGIPEDADYFATGGYDSEAAARDAWDGMHGAITNGQRYAHTFEVPGTYNYFCIPHERGGMVGQVVVE
ncbi:cupredoxin domain-containing protein [Haloplanus rubicundus]|uniref:Halocyanin n=1 Tax=Haloplanus rubicundus TaxID=1547898 RepID=A0A345EFK4_9EURY|nr:plastocyanin/azurin family copper-binding protein [Haloplanus rubicundus]AXG10976.1 halocyanin [Haloplanus rubicundus]